MPHDPLVSHPVAQSLVPHALHSTPGCGNGALMRMGATPGSLRIVAREAAGVWRRHSAAPAPDCSCEQEQRAWAAAGLSSVEKRGATWMPSAERRVECGCIATGRIRRPDACHALSRGPLDVRGVHRDEREHKRARHARRGRLPARALAPEDRGAARRGAAWRRPTRSGTAATLSRRTACIGCSRHPHHRTHLASAPPPRPASRTPATAPRVPLRATSFCRAPAATPTPTRLLHTTHSRSRSRSRSHAL
jgi:hypothetical protein